MFEKLLGALGNGRRPSRSDRELLENVKARLRMMRALELPQGTELGSIPGATVRFTALAGSTVATVFTDDGRFVGSITPSGKFVYTQTTS